MKILATVEVGLDEALPQPVAMECPDCLALIIAAHLNAHREAAHGKAAG